MRLVWKSLLSRQGFTLIEVVITILIAAILGSLVMSHLGTSLVRSADSVWVVRNEGLAEALMERILSDYVKALNSDYAAALANIMSLYAANPAVTMKYVTYDYGTGVEADAGGGNTMKVTVQVGEAKLTSLLTSERSSGSDPYVTY